MANKMPMSGAAAGVAGSVYTKKVSTLGKNVGNYVINETNFPGIGAMLPGWILVVPATAANVTISNTHDGSTWVAMSGTGGGWVYADGVTTRLNVANGATDVHLFAMGG